MSYVATWRYLTKLAAEATFTEAIKSGRWIWIYDNINLHMKTRHEREGH